MAEPRSIGKILIIRFLFTVETTGLNKRIFFKGAGFYHWALVVVVFIVIFVTNY